VNLSDEAYSDGGADSPITVAVHAAVTAKYLFYRMSKVNKAWCPYCITDAVTRFARLVLRLAEAAKAPPRLSASVMFRVSSA
jgi:uncharacterized membrane protein